MSVFDIIPSNFFSVLVSTNREIYVEALLHLHKMFQFELNIKLEDYISELIALQEDREFTPEEDDEVLEGSLTHSGKARLILNRFIKTGWVEKEFMEGSFIEIITPQPYAIPMLKLLNDLEEGETQEYNSLVFATYSALKQGTTEHKEQIYEAVLAARTNTERLQYQLRTLYHGIRSYIREIENKATVNDLLQNHFEGYKQMSDRIYHPIKTTDSLYRYMMPIQNLLTEIVENDELMETLCEKALAGKKYENIEEAKHDMLEALNYVLDSYQSVGGIVTEIDRKNSVYTKSSIDKIRYLMTADQTIKGKLVQLLKAYAKSPPARQEALDDMLEKYINVNRQEFFDGKSLYHKSIRNRLINMPALKIKPQGELSDEALKDMLAQLNNGYSLKRICAYVDQLLANSKGEISSENITIAEDGEFILLLLAVLRAHDREVDYRVELLDGSVERNGYRIPRMIIRKKEDQHHVE